MEIENMEDVAVLLAILFGIAVFSIILAGIVKLSQSASDSAQPVRTEKAKLIEKDNIPAGSFASEIRVLFETESGERIRLRAKVPNSLVVGDEGTLTWQGGKIIKFERI